MWPVVRDSNNTVMVISCQNFLPRIYLPDFIMYHHLYTIFLIFFMCMFLCVCCFFEGGEHVSSPSILNLLILKASAMIIEHR